MNRRLHPDRAYLPAAALVRGQPGLQLVRAGRPGAALGITNRGADAE
ncbi:MAG: hypothetical protein MUO23_08435 [Anaerolineales bacterium]|nr:hypothetical protein [Anaerolineales bacterium]